MRAARARRTVGRGWSSAEVSNRVEGRARRDLARFYASHQRQYVVKRILEERHPLLNAVVVTEDNVVRGLERTCAISQWVMPWRTRSSTSHSAGVSRSGWVGGRAGRLAGFVTAGA